jgi:hypothetical protein
MHCVVDTDTLRRVLPHYVVMLLVVFLVLGVTEYFVGKLGIGVEIVIIFVVVTAYRLVVERVDALPDPWEET